MAALQQLDGLAEPIRLLDQEQAQMAVSLGVFRIGFDGQSAADAANAFQRFHRCFSVNQALPSAGQRELQ